ncbi:alpha/beta hydrolase [Desmospora profundinema]|uniref:Acetyl esterase n=1 Tax=Desmospora profundinema TaxID=1571184 RepID=A0ABU1INQ3_9BACL|nr:alpha/beta hydrolase [Desmospora profundinema]MDR6226411.1 acetyl esterase [Desmospora profundinema]
MPVDPQIKSLLVRIYAHMNHLGHPPLDQLTPEKSRFYFQEGRKFFTQMRIEGVKKWDCRIARPGSRLPIRLYRPHHGERLPILVYFHGGGWVLGDLDSSDEICARLAIDTESLVISVDYRLAPEHKYPAPMLDAVDAVLWARGHAGQWGGDGDRVSVGGESAGANLAAAAAIRLKEMGHTLESQLLITPVTNHAFDTPSYQERGCINLTKERMMWFWNHYLELPVQGLEYYASPLLNREPANLPKSLILTAEWDPLRMRAKLMPSGCPGMG